MENEKKCLRCGGTNVKPSKFESTGRIYSRPEPSNALAYLLTGAHVSALTCLDCGHVELMVDVKKAQSLVKSA